MTRPDPWLTGRPNLVAAYPAHIPMGLPLPADDDPPEPPAPPCPWSPPTP
jgi:hypothetical protein